jgi:hypothetical protein
LHLLEAHEHAERSGRKTWDFASEIYNLTASGISTSALRWLVWCGYVACAQEITEVTDAERRFEPITNLAFADRTCFALTLDGVALTKSLSDGLAEQKTKPDLHVARRSQVLSSTPTEASPDAAVVKHRIVPEWDARRRELRFQGQVVKRFKVPAVNREAVLTAFQEEG